MMMNWFAGDKSTTKPIYYQADHLESTTHLVLLILIVLSLHFRNGRNHNAVVKISFFEIVANGK